MRRNAALRLMSRSASCAWRSAKRNERSAPATSPLPTRRWLCFNAALALSRVGRQSDAERLKKLSESDPDPKVREFAYQGYAALSGKVD